jgi:hypothetical protein
MTTQKRGKMKIKKDLMYLSLDGLRHAEYKRGEDERAARLEREREENRRAAELGKERREKRAKLNRALQEIEEEFANKIDSTFSALDEDDKLRKIKEWFFGALNADQADALAKLLGESLEWELTEDIGDDVVALLSAYPKFREDCGITHDDIYKRALAAQAIEAFDAGEE